MREATDALHDVREIDSLELEGLDGVFQSFLGVLFARLFWENVVVRLRLRCVLGGHHSEPIRLHADFLERETDVGREKNRERRLVQE